MSAELRRNLRYVSFLAMVSVFVLSRHGAASLSARYDGCDDPEVCGPTESCDKPCFVDLFENTCGGYGGEPVDPVRGNCIGFCGNGYCNDFDGEDHGTCYEDCGECGDGMCDAPWEMPGGYSYCEADCGNSSIPPPATEVCEPDTQEGCGVSDSCNARSQCVRAGCVDCCHNNHPNYGPLPCLAGEVCVFHYGVGLNDLGECVSAQNPG